MPPKKKQQTVTAAPSRKRRKAAPLAEHNYDEDADNISDDDEEEVFETKKPKKAGNTAANNKKQSKKGEKEKQDDENVSVRGRKLSLTLGTHFHRDQSSVNRGGLVNNNFLQILHKHRSGLSGAWDQYQRCAAQQIVESISKYGVSQCTSPWSGAQRVTALDWHPRYTSLAAVGSKHGDIILWDTSKRSSGGSLGGVFRGEISGRGPGGSIQSIKFDINHPNKVYTSSIDGTIRRNDFDGLDDKVYKATNDWERWFVGMDVNFSGRTLVAGSNRGVVSLMTLEGERIWDLKLHKSKCNFVQFSEKQTWMMVTCGQGTGAGVKVWDIRNIKDEKSSLAELHHERAVNSAYFSPVSGDKLLTTDQHSQLRVYQTQHFDLLRTIPHPHRQFQHLTQIKGCWHPQVDIVFAGRYPDPQFPDYHEGELRTIDFFSPTTGECLYQLHQPGLSGIISLSQFSPRGDRLLSGMGSTVLLWQARMGREEDLGDEEKEREENIPRTGAADTRLLHHWPDFTMKKKKPQTKKKKTV